jgi:hypothetical protein
MTMRRLSIAAAIATMCWTTAVAAAAPPAKGASTPPPPPAADAAAPAAEKQPSLREVAAHVQWYRGSYSREATGFQFSVPPTFHLAESNDARNLEMASGHPDDPDAVAWIVPLNTPIANPQTWVVRVRWRGDGLVNANPADLETAQLDSAMARPAEKRLASSGGTFKSFVESPQLRGHVVNWVEERTPANGKGAQFDCHAVRLARRGILEFSIIGVGDAVRKTCTETLRTFTDKLTFDDLHEYPDQAGTTPKAPYSLSTLVAQTK